MSTYICPLWGGWGERPHLWTCLAVLSLDTQQVFRQIARVIARHRRPSKTCFFFYLLPNPAAFISYDHVQFRQLRGWSSVCILGQSGEINSLFYLYLRHLVRNIVCKVTRGVILQRPVAWQGVNEYPNATNPWWPQSHGLAVTEQVNKM